MSTDILMVGLSMQVCMARIDLDVCWQYGLETMVLVEENGFKRLHGNKC